MRIAQITCPACGAALFSKHIDLVVRCDRCGQLHTRDVVPQIIGYDLAESPTQGDGERAYYPVWSMDVVFHVDKIENKHDLIFLYGLLNSEVEKEGRLKMFVPAYRLDTALFWSVVDGFAKKPPVIRPGRIDPNVRRLPCVIKPATAERMAHFLFIADMADKRGVLQRLDYRLTVISCRLIYLLDYARRDQNSATDKDRAY